METNIWKEKKEGKKRNNVKNMIVVEIDWKRRYTKLTGFEKVPIHVSFIAILNYVENLWGRRRRGKGRE